MENVENAVRKPRISLILIILGGVLLVGLAVGAYFLFGSNNKKEPSRGTYVLRIQDDYADMITLV